MSPPSASELAWSVLGVTSPVLGELRVRESEVTTEAGPVLHALDTDGRLHLLIPVPGDAPVAEDRASAGVQLIERSLIENGTERRFGDVVCTLPHLDGLFAAVADEMLRSIKAGPGRPTQACHAVLQRWRELLGGTRLALLGIERLVGLLAELRWLERLATFDPVTALGGWVGPTGSRIDFMLRDRGVEVKATLVREGRLMEIHGDRQLEAPEGGDLHLLFVRFEPGSEGGESVPEVVERLLQLGVDRLGLFERMLGAGYDPADAQTYGDFRYSVTEELLYPVDEAFPRIVPRSFVGGRTPERISSLRYTVDLAGEPPSPLYGDGVELLIRSLTGAGHA